MPYNKENTTKEERVLSQLARWGLIALVMFAAAACDSDAPGNGGQGFDLSWVVDDGGTGQVDGQTPGLESSVPAPDTVGPGDSTSTDGSSGDGTVGDAAHSRHPGYPGVGATSAPP